MITLQNKIQNKFNNASKSYDSVAKTQRQAADYLVSKLLKIRNFYPRTILDLGTGTGYVPELLMKSYPQGSYFLNDISSEMLEICKVKFAKHSNITYLNTDMISSSTDTFELVISNFALQWVDNLWSTLEFFYSNSSKVFAFSTLLDGTLQEWENIISRYQEIKLQNYPKAAELINFCTRLKGNNIFDHWAIDVHVSFNSPLTFMRYLKLLGASASNNHLYLSNAKALLKEQNETLTVSYKIFFGIFRKIGS